jgi:hypothetical protein
MILLAYGINGYATSNNFSITISCGPSSTVVSNLANIQTSQNVSIIPG